MFWNKRPKPNEVLRDWLSTPSNNIFGVRRALPIVDNGIRTLQRGAGLACREGCDWCCRQAVTISPQEAIWLGRWMRESLPSDVLAHLTQRIRSAADDTRDLTMAQRAQAAWRSTKMG